MHLSYELLTIHPNIIFVNKPTWCTIFLIYIFLFSACFGQLCAHHQENQLHQCDNWYMSLCVDDRLVCRSEWIPTWIPDGHLHRVTYTRCRIDATDSPDDGHIFARNMQRIEIYKKNCTSSWFIMVVKVAKNTIVMLQ